jgi:hypothetical protein
MARKPDPVVALEQARVSLQAIQVAAAEVNSRRDAALLAGEPAAAIRKLDEELAERQHEERTESDRIQVLEREVERQRIERQAREKASLIGRVEAKFKARSDAAIELEQAIKTADKAFRKIVDLSVECDAAWGFATHERTAAMIPTASVLTAVTHEIYRVGSRPRRYGGQDRGAHPGLHFPGGQCPRLELVNLPESIPPIVNVLRDAANYASQVMRTGKGTPPAGATVVHVPDATTPPQRTAAQERLNQLLQQQMKLSMNPADEQAYLAVVAEIAEVSAEVDAAKAGAPK